MSFALYAVTKDNKIMYKASKEKCQKVFEQLVSETMKRNNVWNVQPAKNKKVGQDI
jgi:NMD protein affecting ribosome stability and mRNA decay